MPHTGPRGWCLRAGTEPAFWHLRKGVRPAVIAAFPTLVSAAPEGCMREADDGGLWVAGPRSLVALVQGGRVETLADTGQLETDA